MQNDVKTRKFTFLTPFLAGVIGFLTIGITGGFLGGMLGFLIRPSAFLVGQLPFFVVITRGMFLKGFDQALMPLAQQSCDIMIGGALIGFFLCAIFGFLSGIIISTLLSKRHKNLFENNL